MAYLHDLDRLVQIANRARVFFDNWWILEGAETRPKYFPAMKRFMEFFRFEPLAHQIACVLHLAQLFETKASTRNLWNLVKAASEAGVDSAAIEVARSELEGSKELQSKVAILRSNVFAHSAGKIGFDEAFELAKITPSQLRELTEVSLRVLNPLLRQAGRKEWWFDSDSADALESMLEELCPAS